MVSIDNVLLINTLTLPYLVGKSISLSTWIPTPYTDVDTETKEAGVTVTGHSVSVSTSSPTDKPHQTYCSLLSGQDDCQAFETHHTVLTVAKDLGHIMSFGPK